MIDEGYGDYIAWKGWSNIRFGSIVSDNAAYFSSEIAASGLRSLAGLQVLELGFGNGQFGAWAQSKGACYSGTERLPALLEEAEANGWRVAPSSCDLTAFSPPSGVDLVAAFDVFEHFDLEQLESTLLAIRDILKPTGLLIARVPSGDSPFARANQHGDLTHLISLGSMAVYQLAHSAGFEVVRVKEPAFPLLGLGLTVFFRRLTVFSLRWCFFKFVSTVLMGNGNAILTPNLVFILRRSA